MIFNREGNVVLLVFGGINPNRMEIGVHVVHGFSELIDFVFNSEIDGSSVASYIGDFVSIEFGSLENKSNIRLEGKNLDFVKSLLKDSRAEEVRIIGDFHVVDISKRSGGRDYGSYEISFSDAPYNSVKMIPVIKDFLKGSLTDLEKMNDLNSSPVFFQHFAMNTWRSHLGEVADFISDRVGGLHDKFVGDIGCGGGGLSIFLGLKGAKVIGCDPGEVLWFARFKRFAASSSKDSKGFVDMCNKYLPLFSLGGGNYKDERGYIKEVPFSLDSVDFVFGSLEYLKGKVLMENMLGVVAALFILSHNRGWKSFINDLLYICKPGGFVFVFDYDSVLTKMITTFFSDFIVEQGSFKDDSYMILRKPLKIKEEPIVNAVEKLIQGK
ncbi:MAG: hypothetical protein PHT91_02820 [Candidatus Nanoarchaeia archaeon]|nr:hypothetical protein [Candidatus Nanoarchaeia archaeon]